MSGSAATWTAARIWSAALCRRSGPDRRGALAPRCSTATHRSAATTVPLTSSAPGRQNSPARRRRSPPRTAPAATPARAATRHRPGLRPIAPRHRSGRHRALARRPGRRPVSICAISSGEASSTRSAIAPMHGCQRQISAASAPWSPVGSITPIRRAQAVRGAPSLPLHLQPPDPAPRHPRTPGRHVDRVVLTADRSAHWADARRHAV